MIHLSINVSVVVVSSKAHKSSAAFCMTVEDLDITVCSQGTTIKTRYG